MKLRKRIRLLEIWAVVSVLWLAVLVLGGSSPSKTRFDEIDVERLNVVEKDGRLVMVVANSDRMPDPVVNGRAWKTERPPGMLFYNGLGDEDGGLVFGAVEGGGKYGAYHGLSFDKFKQSQAIALVYNDHSGRYRAGLQVWDRPETPISDLLQRREALAKMPEGEARDRLGKELAEEDVSPTRLYLGKNADGESELTLADANGKPRVRIVVTAEGDARLDFLDASGKVTSSLPERPGKPS